MEKGENNFRLFKNKSKYFILALHVFKKLYTIILLNYVFSLLAISMNLNSVNFYRTSLEQIKTKSINVAFRNRRE